MKIGNLPNYLVQVYAGTDDVPPEERPLYEGIYTVVLNIVLHVDFVPEVGGSEPPWPAGQEPPENFTTPDQVRWYELLTLGYVVTPSETRAGHAERAGPPDRYGAIFYVSPAEFAQFSRELDDLAHRTAEGYPGLHRDQVLDRSVMRFVDDQVLNSPLLRPGSVEAVGRTSTAP